LAACGSTKPQSELSRDWRGRTTSALASLLVTRPPFPVFLTPTGEPRLRPVLDGVITLRALGQPVPADAERLIAGYRTRDGVYEDARNRDDPFALTWLAVRAARSSRAATSSLVGLERRLQRGGASLTDMLFAARIARLAHEPPPIVPGIRDSLRRVCEQPRASERSLATVAVTVEVAKLTGHACRPGRIARASFQRIAARAAERLSATPAGGDIDLTVNLEVARSLNVLASGGLVRRQTAARATDRALRDARRLAPGLTVAGAMREAIDLARETGGDANVVAASARRVDEIVKWHGRLPEVVGTRDPTDTILGFHALTLLDRDAARSLASSSQVTRAAATATTLSSQSRMLLKLAFGHPEAQDVSELADAKRPTDLSIALVAQTVRRFAATCSESARRALDEGARRITRNPTPVSTVQVFEHALLSNALPVCGSDRRLDRRLRDRVVAEVHALPMRDGGFAEPDSQPDLVATWFGLESSCLVRIPLPRSTKTVAKLLARAVAGNDQGLARLPGDEPSILATYAAIRDDQIVRDGCSGGWWDGALPS
jgi:hypothetical protein